MTRLVEIHTPNELAQVASTGGSPPVAAESLLLEAPDAHWMLLDDATIVARCSLWWRRVPSLGKQRLGAIGHFAAQHSEPAVHLLKYSAEQLMAKGCSTAIGPMDGNTWRRYRFVTDRGSEPPFFLEPDNPNDWPHFFTGAGFSPVATYTSALNTDLSRMDARIASISTRIADAGILIRHANATRMEDELRRVYQMSLMSFQNNFLYTPLEELEFMAQYRKILPHIRAELILIAERDDQPVAFLFAIPDVLRARQQGRNDTIIIKTVAVIPDCAGLGLGTCLVTRAQQLAYDLGFRRAIHALMHESNRSRDISQHTAATMRRYTLYALPLLS